MINLKDFLCALAGIYAIAFFISLEPNPILWSQPGRFIFAVWIVVVCAVVNMIRSLRK